MKYISSRHKALFFVLFLCTVFFDAAVLAQKSKTRTGNPQTSKSRYTLGSYFLLRVRGGYNREQRRKIEDVAPQSVVDQTVEIIRKRLKMLGVPVYIVEREKNSKDLIVVKIPGVDDPELVKWIMSTEGGFEVVQVISPPAPSLKIYRTDNEAIEALGGSIPSNRRIFPNMSCYERSTSNAPGEFFCPSSPEGWIIGDARAIVNNSDLLKCEAVSFSKKENEFQVSCSLKKSSEDAFYKWMSKNINQHVAIVLNGQVNSMPYIKSPSRGAATIFGKFTKKGAEALAAALMLGALPPTYQLEFQEERTINEPYREEASSRIVIPRN